MHTCTCVLSWLCVRVGVHKWESTWVCKELGLHTRVSARGQQNDVDLHTHTCSQGFCKERCTCVCTCSCASMEMHLCACTWVCKGGEVAHVSVCAWLCKAMAARQCVLVHECARVGVRECAQKWGCTPSSAGLHAWLCAWVCKGSVEWVCTRSHAGVQLACM